MFPQKVRVSFKSFNIWHIFGLTNIRLMLAFKCMIYHYYLVLKNNGIILLLNDVVNVFLFLFLEKRIHKYNYRLHIGTYFR
jgi:hypothetical protein